MQEWEYCVIGGFYKYSQEEDASLTVFLCTLQGREFLHAINGPDYFERMVAWLGLQGWEIATFGGNQGEPKYFKRPKRS